MSASLAWAEPWGMRWPRGEAVAVEGLCSDGLDNDSDTLANCAALDTNCRGLQCTTSGPVRRCCPDDTCGC